MAIAAGSWETLDAEAAMAGVDLLEMAPVRVANIVWARQRAALNDEDWRKWITKLTRPLPGTKASESLREFRKRALQ